MPRSHSKITLDFFSHFCDPLKCLLEFWNQFSMFVIFCMWSRICSRDILFSNDILDMFWAIILFCVLFCEFLCFLVDLLLTGDRTEKKKCKRSFYKKSKAGKDKELSCRRGCPFGRNTLLCACGIRPFIHFVVDTAQYVSVCFGIFGKAAVVYWGNIYLSLCGL